MIHWERTDTPLWLLTYDVREARRLRRMAGIATSHGVRWQRSVYGLSLTDRQVSGVVEELQSVLNPREDGACLFYLPAGTRIGRSLGHPQAEGILLA